MFLNQSPIPRTYKTLSQPGPCHRDQASSCLPDCCLQHIMKFFPSSSKPLRHSLKMVLEQPSVSPWFLKTALKQASQPAEMSSITSLSYAVVTKWGPVKTPPPYLTVPYHNTGILFHPTLPLGLSGALLSEVCVRLRVWCLSVSVCRSECVFLNTALHCSYKYPHSAVYIITIIQSLTVSPQRRLI